MRILVKSLFTILLPCYAAIAESRLGKAKDSPSETTNWTPLLEWSTPKPPSNLLKWTVDPSNAWWEKHLLRARDPKSKSTQLPPTPTKCSYIPESTQPECPRGCICSSDDCASIWFTNTSRPEPRPLYHVCTSWKLNHQHQLRAGLEKAGFESTRKPVECGWQKLKFIIELRVARGSIDVNGTEALPWGDMAEVAIIEDVLKREYPFIEILIIVATLVGPIFSLFGWCCWMALWGQRKRGSKRGSRRL
jgi:hypothetical protein